MRNNAYKPPLRLPIDEFDKALPYVSPSPSPPPPPKATTFSSMLSSQSLPSQQECELHCKPLEIICRTCDREVCVDCALFADHRGHHVERTGPGRSASRHPDTATTAAALRAKAQGLLEAARQAALQLEGELQKRQGSAAEAIGKGFEELQSELEQARSAALAAVGTYYQNIGTAFRALEESVTFRLEELLQGLARHGNAGDACAKELREIEQLLRTPSFASPLATDNGSVSFDAGVLAGLKGYCKFTSLAALKRHSLKLKEEDNLLQESFNDSIFKEINESSTALDERPYASYQGSRRVIRGVKSGSFAPGQFSKSPLMPSEFKLSVCNTPLNAKSVKNSSVFKFDDDAFRKQEPLVREASRNPTVSRSSRPTMMTPKTEHYRKNYENSVGPIRQFTVSSKVKTESNLLSDRTPLPRTDTSPLKRQSSRAVVRPPPEGRQSHWSGRPQPQPQPQPRLTQKGQNLTVDLANYGFDDAKLEAYLSQYEVHQAARTITLSGNAITDKGVKHLLKHITGLRVETLYLAENCLRDRALDYILSFSKYNAALKAVFLQENRIDPRSHENKARLAKLKKAGIQIFL